jgi:hypothetical protein
MAEQYAEEGITDYDLYRTNDGVLHHSYTTDGTDAAAKGANGSHNGSQRFGNRSTDTLTLTKD